MNIIIAILGAIFAIFCVVIIHEYGHFIVARCMGIRVLRFSIGFGKPIWSKTTTKGTEFAIGWLPVGGYVRMLGEGDEAPAEDLKKFSYNNKNVFQRMAVVLAGPVMNFILAIVLYWILFLPGVIHVKPVIGAVEPNSIAARAGLVRLDQITAVNEQAVKNWRGVMMAMIASIGDKKIMLTITRPPSAAIHNIVLPIENWQLDQQRPDFLKALGIKPYRPKFPMVIGKVVKDSPAAVAGLQQGDRIIAVDGKKYNDMVNVVLLIRQNPNKTMPFTILRHGKRQTLMVKIGARTVNNKIIGQIGFAVVMPKWPPTMLEKEKYSVFSAWLPAIKQTGSLIKFNAIALGKLITQKMSVRSLGGPISIFQMAGRASQQNYRVYLGFLAFLSVALGFINLLPIPGLDGGHFLFQVIELVFRRPVPIPIQALCVRIGLLLLIFLILSVTVNDLTRLFN